MIWLIADGIAIVALYAAGCAAQLGCRPAATHPTRTDPGQEAVAAFNAAATPRPNAPAPSWATPKPTGRHARTNTTGGHHASR